VQTLWEKSQEFTKIISRHDFHEDQFTLTRIQKVEVLLQVANGLKNKTKEFKFEFETPLN
jgi:hypothetical protein